MSYEEELDRFLLCVSGGASSGNPQELLPTQPRRTATARVTTHVPTRAPPNVQASNYPPTISESMQAFSSSMQSATVNVAFVRMRFDQGRRGFVQYSVAIWGCIIIICHRKCTKIHEREKVHYLLFIESVVHLRVKIYDNLQVDVTAGDGSLLRRVWRRYSEFSALNQQVRGPFIVFFGDGKLGKNVYCSRRTPAQRRSQRRELHLKNGQRARARHSRRAHLRRYGLGGGLKFEAKTPSTCFIRNPRVTCHVSRLPLTRVTQKTPWYMYLKLFILNVQYPS